VSAATLPFSGRTPVRVLSALVILALAAPLLWFQFAFVRSEQALASGVRPALAWNPHRAEFLASAAELAADQAKDARGHAEAARLARQALAAGPLENRALLVLALDADRRENEGEAGRLMGVLGARTNRNTQVQLWLAQRALLAQDYSAGFTHLDAALRRAPGLGRALYPVLAVALEDPLAVRPMAQRLRAGPEWREKFIAYLTRREDAAPQAQALLAALRGEPGGATDAEVEGLMATLLMSGDLARARNVWKSFLPQSAAGAEDAPYDGAFRGLPGAAPFNWRLETDDGVTAERTQALDGRPALHVQYSVARRHILAEQLLLLPPGAYRLTGESMSETGEAPARLSWRMSCAEQAGGDFVETPLSGESGGWRAFSADFDVPAQGCAAQSLRLVNAAQDSFAGADAWISNLRITPR
jgi:hypothetical protein